MQQGRRRRTAARRCSGEHGQSTTQGPHPVRTAHACGARAPRASDRRRVLQVGLPPHGAEARRRALAACAAPEAQRAQKAPWSAGECGECGVGPCSGPFAASGPFARSQRGRHAASVHTARWTARHVKLSRSNTAAAWRSERTGRKHALARHRRRVEWRTHNTHAQNSLSPRGGPPGPTRPRGGVGGRSRLIACIQVSVLSCRSPGDDAEPGESARSGGTNAWA